MWRFGIMAMKRLLREYLGLGLNRPDFLYCWFTSIVATLKLKLSLAKPPKIRRNTLNVAIGATMYCTVL